MVVQPLDNFHLQQLESQLQPDNTSRLITQASNLLSELTHFAGVVATPKRTTITVRQIEFLRLSETRVLLIIVMPDGEVENRVLITHKDYTQSQLTEAGNFLSQHYAGCSFSDIQQRVQNELHQLQHELTALMSAAMAASDSIISRKREDYVISGERNLLNSNDLAANMDRLRGVFYVFEQKTELLQLLNASRNAPAYIFLSAMNPG